MKKIIVGISGASGARLALELLTQLHDNSDVETHLVFTRGAELTIEKECGLSVDSYKKLSDIVYDNSDVAAAIASGSYKTDGMIVIPCSMKTLSGIATGYSENLLLRAADVILKEKRKLVLVPRECPLSTIHLKNMHEASLAGAVILPPMLSFYNKPKSSEDFIRHIVGKVLDQFDIEGKDYKRWE